jgi:hypothetical protein
MFSLVLQNHREPLLLRVCYSKNILGLAIALRLDRSQNSYRGGKGTLGQILLPPKVANALVPFNSRAVLGVPTSLRRSGTRWVQRSGSGSGSRVDTGLRAREVWITYAYNFASSPLPCRHHPGDPSVRAVELPLKHHIPAFSHQKSLAVARVLATYSSRRLLASDGINLGARSDFSARDRMSGIRPITPH